MNEKEGKIKALKIKGEKVFIKNNQPCKAEITNNKAIIT